MESYSSWICKVCTFKNTSEKKCEVCHADFDEFSNENCPIEISDDEDAINGQINGTLAINLVNDGQSSEQNHHKSWKCQRCTLVNKSHLKKCQVCESPRKSRLPSLSDFDPDFKSDSVNNGRSVPKDNDTQSKRETKNLSTIVVIDSSEWKCPSCTFSCNPEWAKQCESCSKPKPENRTRDSESPPSPIEIDRDRVTYVVRPNQESEIQNFKSSHEWNCSKCTLKNRSDRKSCSVCDTPREDSSGWQCTKCTLINLESSSTCRVCKNSRSNSTSTQATTKSSNSKNEPENTLGNSAVGALRRQESCLTEDIRHIEEREAQDLRQRIIHHCKFNKEPFVDDSFPPAPKSLFCNPKIPFCTSPIRWCRPLEISINDNIYLPWVVYRTPLPEDISQGILGNCWFLSALAVLAERRHLVEHIILTNTVCKEGVYQVRLCKSGLWKTVIIDDLLPCEPSGQLVFSKAQRKQLWVPLIEKAMAKLHGSYEALVAGNCIEGLAILTGAPCESVPLQIDASSKGIEICPDMIWAKLLSCRDMKFLMGASCGGGNMKANSEEFNQMGLRARHAYSILDIQVMEGNNGLITCLAKNLDPEKYPPHKAGPTLSWLIQLRNPWGHFSWKGKWSDESPAWQTISQTERQRFLISGHEQGVFWMEFSDLMRYFDSVDICKVLPDWHESRVTGLFPFNSCDTVQAIRLTVFYPTEIDLGLFQESSRGSSTTKSPIDLCIAITCDPQNSGQVSVGPLVTHSARDVHSFAGVCHMFEPGEYLVVPLAFQHWDNQKSDQDGKTYHKYVVSIHSSKRVMVEEGVKGRPYMLADTLIQLAVSKGQREEFRQGLTAYTLLNGWAGSILVIENRLPRQNVYIECDCSQSTNIVSTRGTLQTQDIVPSYHRQVIMVLTQLERRESYHLTRRIVHCTTNNDVLGERSYGPASQSSHSPLITAEVKGLHSPRPYV